MRSTLALCLATCVWQLSAAQTTPVAPSATERTLIIRAGALIDGTSPQPRTHQEILIRGDRIAAVYAAGSKPAPAGATVIDLGSATVLPGLIDTHTHVFLQGEDPSAGGYDVQLLKYPASFRVVRAVIAAKRALDQGFTTIRDVETEGAGYGDVGIQKAINEGYIPGPRMFVATRAISSTGGYSLDDYAPEITVPKGAQIIDGPVEARKAAREQLDHGAD
jgi:imidazolonepropionase-like amidohydrolase